MRRAPRRHALAILRLLALLALLPRLATAEPAASDASLGVATAAAETANALPGWMAGSWSGTLDGVRMEEHWTTAAGGLMVGMHRDVRPDGRAVFEHLRLELRDGQAVYLASPGGRAATPFTATESNSGRIVFENLEHDFPQRIVYWLEPQEGKLCARVEDRAGNGKQWCWSRATLGD